MLSVCSCLLSQSLFLLFRTHNSFHKSLVRDLFLSARTRTQSVWHAASSNVGRFIIRAVGQPIIQMTAYELSDRAAELLSFSPLVLGPMALQLLFASTRSPLFLYIYTHRHRWSRNLLF